MRKAPFLSTDEKTEAQKKVNAFPRSNNSEGAEAGSEPRQPGPKSHLHVLYYAAGSKDNCRSKHFHHEIGKKENNKTGNHIMNSRNKSVIQRECIKCKM